MTTAIILVLAHLLALLAEAGNAFGDATAYDEMRGTTRYHTGHRTDWWHVAGYIQTYCSPISGVLMGYAIAQDWWYLLALVPYAITGWLGFRLGLKLAGEENWRSMWTG